MPGIVLRRLPLRDRCLVEQWCGLAMVQTGLPRYSFRNIPLFLRDDTARNNLLRLLMKSNEISATLHRNLSRGGNRERKGKEGKKLGSENGRQ
ncbi:hypothetical protein TNCV_1721791 [Trichonephila clavipes]|nr:hypothetical protein TNCV_1721791 [Trichonephila clavipes]